MPPLPERLCAVCGVTTTQRCPSCAEHGFNLFLCGREHQKLVWYVHRQVCGASANPFRFPPLTEEERVTAMKYLDMPQFVVRGNGGRNANMSAWPSGVMTVASAIQRDCECPPDRVPHFLDCHVRDILVFASEDHRINQLCNLRILLRCDLLDDTNQFPGPTHQSSLRNDVPLPPWVVSNLKPSSGRYNSEKWFFELQHFLLVWFAVRYRQQLLRFGGGSLSFPPSSHIRRMAELEGWLLAGEDRLRHQAGEVASNEGWELVPGATLWMTVNAMLEVSRSLESL